ncbi:MAG: O-antigen ligase family protein [Aquabacterium sp.]|nr:O-antigen ligase family protein [Aquabacterium sp.]
MNQLLGWCFVLLCMLMFSLVAFPSYGELKFGGMPNLAPSRLLRMLMLVLMGLIMLIKPFRLSLTSQTEPWAKATYYVVVAFWLWNLPLALFNSFSLGHTYGQLKNETIPVWLSFWLSVALIKRPQQVVWLVRALALATVVVVAVVAVEVVLKRNIFDGLMQVENFSTELAFLDQSRDGNYRAKATFQHPLSLAHFLVSFGLLFVSRGLFHAQPFKGGVLWWGLGLVSLVCVYFTNTRSGLAVGAVFLMVLLSVRFLVWLRSVRSRLMATVLALQLMWLPFIVAAGLYLAADLLAGRTIEERSSTSSRVISLFNGLDGVAQSPLIGHGIGLGAKMGGIGVQYSVDNLFLLEALNNGIPAALLLLGCLGLAAWRLLPRWQELESGENIGLRMGLVLVFATSIAMFVLYALTDIFEPCFMLIGASLCLPGRYGNSLAHIGRRS